MYNYSRLILCAFVPLALQACDSSSISGANEVGIQSVNTGEESAVVDLVNLDIGGSELVYAPFCQEEPFKSQTTGIYKGVIANEIFSEFSRCEFDISLSIEAAGADNQSCEQAGLLSFIGTQTVSSDFPSVCASVENQSVTIAWNLQEHSAPNPDGSQIELVRDLSYPLEAFVSSWGIELLPEENEEGVQIEYPGVLFSLHLNENLTISGGDDDLYTGVLSKTE